MAKGGADDPILLDDEVEGDIDSTSDFVFVRIGASVPLKPSNAAFDLRRPPSQPIAISQRHRLLFLAHADGFFVARTDDVVEMAKDVKEREKEIKEKGEAPSVADMSLMDVKIGRVSILAVSGDQSILAAAVDRNIYFYSVLSLLNKDQKPSFSCSFNESGIVKDLIWQKNMERSFIVLSSHGSLYHGTLEAELKNVMQNVDAADWSAEGSFVVVARKGIITIFSSNFMEILNMALFFESWPPIDAEYTVKVDAIRWLRGDSIIIGCLQVNEDGEEEGYLVQVIKITGHNFSELSSKPVVYSFPDLFDGVWDILPIGRGPYLLANYLDFWEVLLASNQKAIDQHISLFKWSVEDQRREVVSLELRSDKYTPKILVTASGDDTLVLGFCVASFSFNEKIKIQVDDEFKEISPRCTLFCLTSEGTLNLFHAARVTDRLDPLQTFVAPENNNTVKEKCFTSSLSGASTINLRLMDDIEATSSQSQLKQIGTALLDSQTDIFQPQSLAPQQKQVGAVSHAGHLTGQLGDSKLSKEAPIIKESGFIARNDVTLGLKVLPDFSANRVESTSVVDINSSTRSLLGEAQEKTNISFASGSHSDAQLSSSKYSNIEPQPSMFSSSKSTQRTGHSSSLAATGNAEMLRTFQGSQTLAQESFLGTKSNYHRVQRLLQDKRASKYSQTFDSESEISKQFYNVKNMTQELDVLLSFIEKEGGFRDACTVYQRSSLLALENVLGDLAKISHKCKKDVEERLLEIQQLQNKMLQVSARQAYMKGIVEQASNNKYWDIWNQQKLNPELEAIRQNILNANQNLTNQIIELERHFNTVELRRFGESGRTSLGHTASQSSLVHARQRGSLQRVYNTLNSQLTAAMQLSECLSKQMSELQLDSASASRQNKAKELFESIGLSDQITSIQYPVYKMPSLAPDSCRRMPPSASYAVKEHLRKKTSSVANASEPETVRRRRDSLDRNWAAFEPPKTTVKRSMQVQHHRVSADKPFRKAKEMFDSQMEAFSVQQKSNGTHGSSSLQNIRNEGMQDGCLKQAIQAQSNSGALWAEDSFTQTSIFGSKSHLEVGTGKTSNLPPSMTPSPSRVCSSQSSTKDLSKPLPANTSSRYTFSTFSSPPSPLNTRPVVEAKHHADSNLNLTNRGTALGFPISSKTNHLVDSSEGFSFTTNKSNISTLSSVPGFPYAGNATELKKATTTSQLSERISDESSNPEVSVPTSSSLSLPFSTCVTSVTTSIRSSLTPASTPPLPFGKSSPSAKPADITNETVSLSASTQANSQILSSSSLVLTPSKIAVNQTAPIPNSKHVMSSIDANSVASNQGASGSTSASGLYTRSLSSSSTLFSQSQESSATTIMPSSTASKTPTITEPAPPAISGSVHLDNANSKSQPTISQSPAHEEFNAVPKNESNLITTSNSSTSSPFQPSTPLSTAQGNRTAEEDGNLGGSSSQDDEMEEEAPETSAALSSLGGFGLGTTSPSAPKSNPFGSSFLTANSSTASPAVTLTAPAGEPFRPASFILPPAQPVQTPQVATNLNGGFGALGQPAAHAGAGQQALGSVLGSFGQSRQLGSGVPGVGAPSPSGFSGSGYSPAAGGFAGAAAGGGFTSVASAGGGFAAAASKGGGFASVASGGGFAGAATGGGFGTVAPTSGGFTSGGFGAFGSNQGSGFNAFGGNSGGTGNPPPAQLFTQMRK